MHQPNRNQRNELNAFPWSIYLYIPHFSVNLHLQLNIESETGSNETSSSLSNAVFFSFLKFFFQL